MEAAVLLGLVAVGYLKNKEDSGDNPIIPSVNGNPIISMEKMYMNLEILIGKLKKK